MITVMTEYFAPTTLKHILRVTINALCHMVSLLSSFMFGTAPTRQAVVNRPTTSTGTDVLLWKWTEKTAAAGKMASDAAPLKGKELCFYSSCLPVKVLSCSCVKSLVASTYYPAFFRVTKPAFLPVVGKLAKHWLSTLNCWISILQSVGRSWLLILINELHFVSFICLSATSLLIFS